MPTTIKTESSINEDYYPMGRVPQKKNWVALKPEELSPRQFIQLSSDPDLVFLTPKQKALSLLKISSSISNAVE
jgi:hypothetical protein